MKKYIINFVFTVAVCSLSAQNESEPESTSGKNKSGGGKKVQSINRTYNVLPQSDKSKTHSFNIQRDTEVKPESQPTDTEFNTYKESFVGTGKTADSEIDPWGFAPSRRYLNRWFRDITGGRMFLEYMGTVGVGEDANHRLEWHGVFGYQFNPIFFLGVGQGYLFSLNKQETTAPTYGVLRVNFLDENTTPFFDMKTGYSFLGGQGFYINPNVGVSFGRKRRAWNISAGYSFQKAKVKKKTTIPYHEHYNFHGVSLRVSFEFSVFK